MLYNKQFLFLFFSFTLQYFRSSNKNKKKILMIPLTFGKPSSRITRQKLTFLENYTIRWKSNILYKQHLTHCVINGGESVVIWGCFAAPRLGQLPLINETLNYALQQKILKKNIWLLVGNLKVRDMCGVHQDNDPKHPSKSTSEHLKI